MRAQVVEGVVDWGKGPHSCAQRSTMRRFLATQQPSKAQAVLLHMRAEQKHRP
jgi:hypothetical protein